MENVTVFDHPLIRHKVTHLCDVNTGSKEFCEIVSEITTLMGYEVLKDLPTKMVEIQAPLSKFESPVIAEDFTIVPILRAGLGMVDGLRSLLPTAKVGHVGLYRDEETLQPVQYYFKLPVDVTEGEVIIVDPAFATGVSAEATIKLLKEAGCKRIKFMCIFSCDQGIEFVHSRHPEVPIYAAYHSTYPLNEKGYIIDAAGDAGDRICGTVSYKPQ
ncbi:MAG: uracil phosphoribosyltransferase [Clostridiales bacterium]|nr:uracil phosphoribosyltransferase [Clostridiales bacterium]MBQ2156918.1 uracil phosphoribosyltransferase [Clostridiales bacterium]MBQ5519279.1 uracil phosphoribosyltransferase [Clostridiales bacterium]